MDIEVPTNEERVLEVAEVVHETVQSVHEVRSRFVRVGVGDMPVYRRDSQLLVGPWYAEKDSLDVVVRVAEAEVGEARCRD